MQTNVESRNTLAVNVPNPLQTSSSFDTSCTGQFAAQRPDNTEGSIPFIQFGRPVLTLSNVWLPDVFLQMIN